MSGSGYAPVRLWICVCMFPDMRLHTSGYASACFRICVCTLPDMRLHASGYASACFRICVCMLPDMRLYASGYESVRLRICICMLPDIRLYASRYVSVHFPASAVIDYWTSLVFWVILKITNSAGFTGATPMTQISLPLSISSWLMVARPMFTKNA